MPFWKHEVFCNHKAKNSVYTAEMCQKFTHFSRLYVIEFLFKKLINNYLVLNFVCKITRQNSVGSNHC